MQDTVLQLQRFIDAMAAYHDQCYGVMKQAKIFPLEVDLDRTAFTYNTGIINTGEDDSDDAPQELGEELGSEMYQNSSQDSFFEELSGDMKLIDLSTVTVVSQQDSSKTAVQPATADILLLNTEEIALSPSPFGNCNSAAAVGQSNSASVLLADLLGSL